MGHSRTPTQNTAGDGFPADPIDGYVCGLSPSFSHAPRSAPDVDGWRHERLRDLDLT
jgi:hypothetical protein